jgi:hypothetical protein
MGDVRSASERKVQAPSRGQTGRQLRPPHNLLHSTISTRYEGVCGSSLFPNPVLPLPSHFHYLSGCHPSATCQPAIAHCLLPRHTWLVHSTAVAAALWTDASLTYRLRTYLFIPMDCGLLVILFSTFRAACLPAADLLLGTYLVNVLVSSFSQILCMSTNSFLVIVIVITIPPMPAC